MWENYKSRTITRVSYVCLPVNRRSEAKVWLLTQGQGLAAFGLFITLVEMAALCPTRGVLSDEKGPITPSRVVLRLGNAVSEEQVAHLWSLLTHPMCGWLVQRGVVECGEGAERSKAALLKAFKVAEPAASAIAKCEGVTFDEIRVSMARIRKSTDIKNQPAILVKELASRHGLELAGGKA